MREHAGIAADGERCVLCQRAVGLEKRITAPANPAIAAEPECRVAANTVACRLSAAKHGDRADFGDRSGNPPGPVAAVKPGAALTARVGPEAGVDCSADGDRSAGEGRRRSTAA